MIVVYIEEVTPQKHIFGSSNQLSLSHSFVRINEQDGFHNELYCQGRSVRWLHILQIAAFKDIIYTFHRDPFTFQAPQKLSKQRSLASSDAASSTSSSDT
ncbi:hypothetical protein A0H81_14727 [Grifola frondosa]|uniref:Uncharacterized protein n=1 Tax=Grifola frondosa TaxID=5627 RepID=A0A1C7LM99_GRIFR|nr:hypothetical protein A0H81_14727 [Grifola frondosa]